jgi:pantetheine-phosphate adenylyltransferase
MEKVALFPGSFDPFTKGHYDIVIRGLKLFDRIIIAVGQNTNKQRYFPLDLMMGRIRQTFIKYDKIEVITYQELTASAARKHGARYLLRGLRNTTDFEYENSIAQMNQYLNHELETVFLITSPEYASISSSIIREVHRYKGNVNEFLPYDL